MIPQPPYLPDLSPRDYFLFPTLKSHLVGQHCDKWTHPPGGDRLPENHSGFGVSEAGTTLKTLFSRQKKLL